MIPARPQASSPDARTGVKKAESVIASVSRPRTIVDNSGQGKTESENALRQKIAVLEEEAERLRARLAPKVPALKLVKK